jgi:hypothetical protein
LECVREQSHAIRTGEQPEPEQNPFARLPPRQLHNKCSQPKRRDDGAKNHQRKVLAQIGRLPPFRDSGEERVDHNATKVMLNSGKY